MMGETDIGSSHTMLLWSKEFLLLGYMCTDGSASAKSQWQGDPISLSSIAGVAMTAPGDAMLCDIELAR